MRLSHIALLAWVAMLVVACAGDSGSDSTAAAVPSSTAVPTSSLPSTVVTDDGTLVSSITISDFSFSGAANVPVGTTVTATNQDGVTHTWTSDDDLWDSGPLRNDESFEFTFDQPGTYTYFCKIHNTMTGSITVDG